MTKLFTSALILTATLLLTGCNGNSASTTTSTSSLKTQEIKATSIQTRTMINTYYDVVDSGNNPVDMIEYQDTNISLEAFHSDSKEDMLDLDRKYTALTGKKLSKKEGNYIVAKAGVKNDSSYEIQVRMVENIGSTTKVYVSVVHSTTECLSAPVLSAPYTIIHIPNDHKKVEFEVSHLEIKCN